MKYVGEKNVLKSRYKNQKQKIRITESCPSEDFLKRLH